MRKPTDLLKRWAAVEPEQCVRRPAGTFGPFFSSGHTAIPESSQDLDDEVKALLQFDVQQAIEARGWTWSVNFYDGHHNGIVWYGGPDEFYVESSDSPAKALLESYLQAIEATAEVDHE